jgi:hypothetical protein
VREEGRLFMRIPRSLAPVFVLLLLAGGACRSFGQWVTQTITLNPGWNAVYLEVQPANPDCDVVFAGVPVESAWFWNRRFSSVQFIQDPNQLVPGEPDWLTYLPPDHPARATRNLYAIQGAKAYLIKLKAGAAQTVWTIKGTPLVRPPDWLSDSFNFVGFPISPLGAPTFQGFFSGSPAHAGQAIYQLSATGQWTLVSTPAGTTMQAGRAYWIYCKGASTFSGPVQITLEERDGLVYGHLQTEQTLRIKNNSSAVKSVTIQELASQAPPGTNFPVLAGDVPLSYYVVDATNRLFGWISLPGLLQNPNLQPGAEWVLRLQVNRTQMADFVPPRTAAGVLYQSILQVADDNGIRTLIGVSSEGLTSYTTAAASVLRKDLTPTGDPRAGLWVGSAVINAVSQPANASSPTNPLPVGTPLQFRLLVHVDANGNARLLQKVLEMFKEGTVKPDPNNPSNNIVDPPGHYVLLTDDSLIANFTGATLRDSTPVGRRLSSAVFGFRHPVLLTGAGGFGTGDFACQVNLDYDDPVNPFKHRYHPNHDNLDERFQNKLPEGVESFTVNRQIELQFTAQDPDNLTFAGWGDDQLGGIYRETITGLNSQLLFVSGTFRLTRASTIGILNDGLQ